VVLDTDTMLTGYGKPKRETEKTDEPPETTTRLDRPARRRQGAAGLPQRIRRYAAAACSCWGPAPPNVVSCRCRWHGAGMWDGWPAACGCMDQGALVDRHRGCADGEADIETGESQLTIKMAVSQG